MHSWIAWLMGIASSVMDWFPWRKKKVTGRESKKYVVNDFHFPGNAAQKRNRRRKPSKKMVRLYQLKKHGQYGVRRRV